MKSCGCSKGIEKGSPVELAGLASYAEGAIVSRTILEGDGGNLTVFAFDKGQGLNEHSAPFDAAVQVLDGKAEIAVAGKWNAVSAGGFIIMPADVPHAVRAPERFKMLLAMVRK